jgi:calmodulin
MSDSSLSQNQVKEYKEFFGYCDKDQDGKVSRQDLENTLLTLGIRKTAGEIRDMIDECDPTRSGYIEFTTFLTVLSGKLRDADREEVIRDAFLSFDTEKKGYIPANELKKALTTWGTKPLTNEEWSLMLKEVGGKEGGPFEYDKLLASLYGKSA